MRDVLKFQGGPFLLDQPKRHIFSVFQSLILGSTPDPNDHFVRVSPRLFGEIAFLISAATIYLSSDQNPGWLAVYRG